jgi:hypothetical protein
MEPMQMCTGIKQHKYPGVITGLIFAGSLFAFAVTPAYSASTTVHQAYSYGAEVKVGGVVKLGPEAYAELPSCYVQNAGNFMATVASVEQTGLVSTGVVNSVASATVTSSTGSADVFGVNLLGGLITSTEIKAVSTSSVGGNGTFQFSAAGSTFGNLTVLGLPLTLNVAPNTVIALPGIGSMTLNEQTTYLSADEAELTVNMIHVRITLGANKGTEIIVSSANSMIKRQSVPAVVGGYAYAPTLVAGPVTTGPLVLQLIPCFGTNGGGVESDSVAATNIPGIVTTGTVTVTGEGSLANHDIHSQATSSIAGLNLLSGLVTATAINGVATALTTDGINFQFSGGSTFVGLTVAGFPAITDDVAPNTAISVAGLGTLYLNRVQTFDGDRIKVTPIELYVNKTNSLLPIGADLTLGASEAQLHNEAIP